MNAHSFGLNSPRSFNAYPRSEYDIESLTFKNPRKLTNSEHRPTKMLRSIANRIKYYYKLHPVLVFLISLSFGITVLVILSMYESHIRTMSSYTKVDVPLDAYPFSKLKNLVMVAGHSVYTSNSCGQVDNEDSWFLESYQRHPGQAAAFLSHIKEGVSAAAKDDTALLLFSGGQTRKEAGPRSEAQSYWLVADSKEWFGRTILPDLMDEEASIYDMTNAVMPINHTSSVHTSEIGEQDNVRWRTLTEEHARDSYENLLFTVCRFRELTGTYPSNITVVSYDFKEESFATLHRSTIKFPEARFSYIGTPASSIESAKRGEALVRAQFQRDPYGCTGSLLRKKVGRDPFHRTIPYPDGCPEIEGLFRHCGTDLYPGRLPWS